ncbi:hypothetical protein G9E11_01800 [Arthrobacter sp. IA7]|uniref:hypothetical protein n=1 Tax=Arthrobacter ipis TaxID=2716202 RepID=UPI00168A1718|nr:hypothetical protein [Arthrobacter ipis]MBD1541007.1 hypothetical protein [Arthrobacter ipis]
MAIAKESTLRNLLLDRSKGHRERSAARAAAAMSDGATFTETWADTAAWSPSAFGVVNNGVVQGNGQAANSGANHAFALKDPEKMRAVTSVTFNGTGIAGGGRMIVGVSFDAPGAAATSGATNAVGLSFTGTGIYKWGAGAGGTEVLLNTPGAAFTYTVTITVDNATISVVAVRSDGGADFAAQWLRSSIPSNKKVGNLFVFNSATAGDTTNYIGAIGARKEIATLAPRMGIEGQQRTVHWTTTPTLGNGNYGARIALPRNYDHRVPSPLILFSHSHGANESQPYADGPTRNVINALHDAGYIVASTVGTPVGFEFGNPSLVDSQAALYKYVRDHYNVSSVSIYAISMGGLGGLNSARDPRIPGVRAFVASSPICSLAYAYANAAQGWPAEVRTAYGVASDGSNYAAKTAGSDPLLKPTDFEGIPMLIIASPGDTIVTKAANTDAFVTALNGITDTTVITASGEHNDTTQYPGASIVAFFDRYA